MKTRTTHTPFWPTLRRYAKTLRKDVSLNLSMNMLLRILLVAAVAFFVFDLLGWWARVYNVNREASDAVLSGDARQTWKQFLFAILGAIDAKPEAGSGSVLYSDLVRLVGAIVVGGVVTSFFCALAERIADMKLRGLLVPVMRDHFVVVGSGAMTEIGIETIFKTWFVVPAL